MQGVPSGRWLTFSREPAVRIASHGADPRMVLLRDSDNRGETTQRYAPGETGDETPGVSAGLWVARDAGPDNRVFHSTVGKPPSVGTVRRDLRKLVPDKRWPHGPKATAWNPQALELTVLGCLSETALTGAGRTDVAPDQPAVVAAAAHQLRFHDEYHPLSRPLPLHLAKLARSTSCRWPRPRRPDRIPADRSAPPLLAHSGTLLFALPISAWAVPREGGHDPPALRPPASAGGRGRDRRSRAVRALQAQQHASGTEAPGGYRSSGSSRKAWLPVSGVMAPKSRRSRVRMVSVSYASARTTFTASVRSSRRSA